jgi:hypothetical protein
MRRSQRLIACRRRRIVGRAGRLRGGMGSFDPSDLLDFLDTKKKLPGERKPVFPEGVPGLEQGVPKDLYKGSRQEQIDRQNAEARGGGRCAACGGAESQTWGEVRQATSDRQPGAATCRRAGSRCRAGGGWQHGCCAAAAQAGEDRAPPHHRAAAGSAGRPTRAIATIRRAIPGAAAERHLYALIRCFIH